MVRTCLKQGQGGGGDLVDTAIGAPAKHGADLDTI